MTVLTIVQQIDYDKLAARCGLKGGPSAKAYVMSERALRDTIKHS